MNTTHAEVLDDAPCGQLVVDATGRIGRSNNRFADWTDRPADALAGQRFKDLLTPASRILHETHYAPLLAAQGFANEVMLELLGPQRERVAILVCAVRRPDGSTYLSVFDARETRRHERALVAARQDAELALADLQRAHVALARQSEELRATLVSIADGVVCSDHQGRIRSINLKAQAVLGVSENEVLGQPLAALGAFRRPGGRLALRIARRATRRWSLPCIETELVRGDGSMRQISGTAAAIAAPGGGTVFVCRDVTEERQRVRQLAHDASHDHLTGLLNRREFERRLACCMRDATTDGPGDLLCYIDLDQFKIINDMAGHAAGDRMLVEVGEVLRRAVRRSDTLARLGGDEFGVILTGCSAETGAAVAEDMRMRLAGMRFLWEGQAFTVTASIGVSALDGDMADAAAALAVVDMACHAAKEGGRNRVRSFDATDPAMLARRDDMGWVGRIRQAIDGDLLALAFQPIARLVDRPGSRPHGEVLLRLRDEAGRLLPPGPLIAAAERFQQMQPIDRWVVDKALAWLRREPEIDASINLSGQSVGDPRFLAEMLDALRTSGVAPGRICFEITETAAMSDPAAALAFMNALRSLGVRFALDDFGVGLSSFSYLQKLPVDYVKIDGSFISDLLLHPVNRAIVESIVNVARICGLETVAEWVETAEVADTLRAIGVDHVQGWHVGRPVPIDSVIAARGGSA